MSRSDKYLIAIAQSTIIGFTLWQKLMANFKTSQGIWQANIKDLMQAGLNQNIAQKFSSYKKQTEPDQLISQLSNLKIKTITIEDKFYPKLLKEIYSPPLVIYYYGNLSQPKLPIAIVGSRKFSSYGKRVTEQLAGELAQAGFTIVSGLALGVDAIAHQAALKNKGNTIAILGSGLGKIYPASNINLARQIVASGGTVMSEFAPTMPGLKQNFPQRNRIISGLSLATIVTQAAAKSGSLITAHFGLEQNREVFAVPADIYRHDSAGTNNLIKMGAKLITSTAEIVEELGLILEVAQHKNSYTPENEAEKTILNILDKNEVSIDKISLESKLNISEISANLTALELKGIIKQLANKNYIRV